jgi:thiol-disulfide isomerase/thioredoxin
MKIEFEKMKQDKFSFVYITTKNCNVCKVIQPQMRKLARSYSASKFHLIELDDQKEASGFFMVFSVPTILVYSESKELIRTSRHLNFDDIKMKLDRYYEMIFSKNE